ncbi:hypothetical protein AGMMS49546_17350 [Spirochaetia bacterium]|nr:hypothetical protein AGMMS49546_17350 [Spirochaetia bacterium]
MLILLAGGLVLTPQGLAAQVSSSRAAGTGSIVGDTFEEAAGRGLLIRTKPAGAKVYIDGVERGLSPLPLNTLEAGEYHVRLYKEGWLERQFTVRISASSRLVASIELKEASGHLFLKIRRSEEASAPAAIPFAPVLIAGGETFPVPEDGSSGGTGLSLPVGYHTIRARAFGWEDASVTIYVREGEAEQAELVLSPALFRLSAGRVSRNKFNPANPSSLGSTECGFEVSGPGTGTMTVLDQEGRAVYTADLAPFKTWSQSAVWNGRSGGGPGDSPGRAGGILPDGVYTLLIEAESAPWDGSAPERQSLSLPVTIDSSLAIYPLSIFGAIPGLLFAPVPGILPRGSFQIEADMLFGQTPESEDAFTSLPFEVGIRLSPLERLEIAAALDMVPVFGDKMPWGFSGSLKWLFLNPGEKPPLGLAAAFTGSWAEDKAVSPQREGASLYFPLSWQFSPFFSVLLSPGVFWHAWNEGTPRLFLSTGILFRHSLFSAGISFRPEFDLSDGAYTESNQSFDPVTLMTAAEIKFYPPPSNLVFTLSGGIWSKGNRKGGFGGIAIGIVY